MPFKLEVVRKDITQIQADAIVNAANKTLLGGGGVDGAIHRVAGPELLEECKILGGCETGQAKITKAYNLPAKYIIHTVGPVWEEENGKESELLGLCYLNSLKLAEQYDVKSIVFPCISTGVFHFPKDQAAQIAVLTVKKYFEENINSKIKKVIFATLDELDYNLYTQLLNQGFVDISKI